MSVAFSPNGTLILTGGRDRAVRLWDAATLLPIGPALLHRETVYRVGFSADGYRLITGAADGRTRVWQRYAPRPGGAQQVMAWVEAETGLRLGDEGAIHLLPSEAWSKSRAATPNASPQTAPSKP
jgi:hypothetical protein